MPAVLREHQYELCDVNGNNGTVFGTEDTGYLTLSRPVLTTGDPRTNDAEAAGADGIRFGRDYYSTGTLNFEVGVLTDHLTNLAGGQTKLRRNLDALNALQWQWKHKRWRNDTRTVAMLRAHEGGEVWRFYGRPRRYDEVVGTLTDDGYTPVVMDFVLADDAVYSDAVYSIGVPIGAAGSAPGLIFPLSSEFTSVQRTAGGGAMVVAGSRDTWPVVQFTGPCLEPSVVIEGALHIGLTGSLAPGEVVVCDPRPWVRSCVRTNDGVGFSGRLDRATPKMEDWAVSPGSYNVVMSAKDNTGWSGAALSWRHARSRP